MNSIAESLEVLKKIQVLDKEIYDMEVFLIELPERLGKIDQEFEEKKTAFNDLEEQIQQFKLKNKEDELELNKKDAEVEKLDSQLASLKTNKDYKTMLEQIASIKADKSMMEEKVLTEWQEVEKLNIERKEEKEKVDKEEAVMKQQKQELDKESSEAKSKIDSLKKEKETILEPVEKETKELYERILKKREGVALAKADDENCSACHVHLRPQIINEVRLKENLICCENCTRILYEENA